MAIRGFSDSHEPREANIHYIIVTYSDPGLAINTSCSFYHQGHQSYCSISQLEAYEQQRCYMEDEQVKMAEKVVRGSRKQRSLKRSDSAISEVDSDNGKLSCSDR